MTEQSLSERSIFVAAIEKGSQAERAAYLDQVCGSNEGLRKEVESLLAAHDQLGSVQLGSTIDQPTRERPGTVIGPYKLLQQIGEGGMGTVYMAEQTQPVQRKVALKVIKAGMDSRQVIARFEAERQALAMMDHVNIARVLDAGATESGLPYFVMELVHGVPITKYCDDNHLTPRERLELFVPVCQAIQHAHQKGIIHRDIKPSNVMITLYDGKPVPKVIDFGVAKATEQKLTERTLFTQYGTMVGTLEYMSPEQAEMSALGVDTRSDIYSLGVLLYELLTGSTPLSRKRMKEAAYGEILRMIKEEEPPKPSTRLSDSGEALASISAQRKTEPAKLSKLMRGELDWIVMKTLEKDRNRRYETANGFAQDLHRYLADEPVLACPPSARYRLGKFARRNKTAVAVAALVLFFLVLLGSGIGWATRDRSAREAEAARQQAERQGKVAGQVESVFAEVDRLEGEQKWPEALAAARRAEAAVAGGEADPATAERVRQRLKDLELTGRLEWIRMGSGLVLGLFNNDQRDRDYARAFREYGADVDALPAEASIDRLKARPAFAIALAAALDDWVFVRRLISGKDSGRWKRVVAVARGIDPEPLRDQLRAAWGQPAADVRDDLRRLADSIDVRAQHPATLFMLARTLVRVQQPDAALRLLREAQYAHPADYWLNANLAVLLSERKDDEGAIRFFTAALVSQPRAAAAHNNLGLALAGQKKWDEAVACYKRALELSPEYVMAHQNLGDTLAEQNKLDDAIAEYRIVLKLAPAYVQAHGAFGEVLHRQKNFDEAVARFKKAIELDPKLAPAHHSLGNVLWDQGKLPEAMDAYRKAIELDPKRTSAYLGLGNALNAQKRFDEAIACYKKVIELDPKLAPSGYTNLGIALSEQGKLSEAMDAHRKAIELDPKFAPAYINLGITLRQQGKLSEAVDAHRKAIELDPKYARAYINLGIALHAQKKLGEAVAAYRKAIELDTTWVDAYISLGVIFCDELRDYVKAVEYCRKAIELAPKLAGAHFNLGNALRGNGQVDEAIAAYRKAIELEPDLVGAYVNLGIALRAKGRLNEAIAAQHKAVEMDPSSRAEARARMSRWAIDSAAHDRPADALRLIDELLALSDRPKDDLRTDSVTIASCVQHFRTRGDPAACRAAAAALEKKNPADANSVYNAACCRALTAAAQAQAGGHDAAGLAKEEADRAMAWLTKAVAAGFADPVQLGQDADLDPLRDREDFRKLVADLVAKAPPAARARYYICLSQWDNAATEYAKADLLAQRLSDDAFAYACLFLIRGDGEGYDRFCQGMMRRAGQRGVDPFEAYVLARSCAMARKSPVDPTRAVQWANQAVASDQPAWYFHALGLAQHRAGQFDQALQSFTKANVEAWSPRDLNCFGLALVHHRLGQPNEARRYLDKGIQWLERERPPGPGRPVTLLPMDWLEAHLLLREAEELIGPKSKEKPDKK